MVEQTLACRVPGLYDYAFVSLSDADLRRSDHQGLSAARGEVTAEDFLFEGREGYCGGLDIGESGSLLRVESRLDVTVGGGLGLRSSGLRGRLYVDDALDSVEASVAKGTVVRGAVRQQRSQLRVARGSRPERPSWYGLRSKAYHDSRSFLMDQRSVVVPVERSEQEIRIVLDSNDYSRVFLKGEDLEERNIVIQGSARDKVVINVTGSPSIFWLGRRVTLIRGIGPGNILWNFPDTTRLLIAHTKDAVYGIPGTVLAPFAEVQFYEGLITGELIAGAVIFDHQCWFGKASGQINRGPWAGDEPSPMAPYCPDPARFGSK